MALTDTAIKQAKAAGKPVKLYDERGLFLMVNPNGSKLWRFKYRFDGKEKLLALGAYPDLGLKKARDKREEARQLLANGADPAAVKKATKESQKERAANSFEVIAREWHTKVKNKWDTEHADRVLRRLEADVFPWVGGRPVAEVTAPELLTVMRRIEARGAYQTAHRAHQDCGRVFRYAIATGRAERDPAADLRGALVPYRETHHATIIDPKQIADLLTAIDGYKGSFIVRCALRLAPLVFVRPGELRAAKWSEVDLRAAEWRIPAERMKMRQAHIVPLSRQALRVLDELHRLTGHGDYLFPGMRGKDRPMSENTINAALRRLGYSSEEMTGHGFRSMASTLLNEQGWNRDAIERQLAHAERDKVRDAYNRAEHLPERRRMMQAWADYLDVLVLV